MSYKSVLVLDGEVGIASSLSALTATELAQYVLGYFENLHVMMEVKYPKGKRAFLIEVLCQGYTECIEVTAWAGVPEIVHLDLEELAPTPAANLDHESFSDPFANRLMLKIFAANL